MLGSVWNTYYFETQLHVSPECQLCISFYKKPKWIFFSNDYRCFENFNNSKPQFYLHIFLEWMLMKVGENFQHYSWFPVKIYHTVSYVCIYIYICISLFLRFIHVWRHNSFSALTSKKGCPFPSLSPANLLQPFMSRFCNTSLCTEFSNFVLCFPALF